MFGRKQTLTLLTLLIGLLSLTLLATNLVASGWIPTIENTFSIPMPGQADGAAQFALDPELIEKWRWLIAATLIGLTIFSIIALWRYPRLRPLALGYGAVFLIVYWLITVNFSQPIEEVQVEESTERAPQLLTLPEFDTSPPEIGEAPSWFGLVVALFVAVAVVAIVTYFLTRQRRTPLPQPLAAEIVLNAESAIAEIEQGYDLQSAIIKAYMQMTETVRHHRGLVRKRTMTASEFAIELQDAGLPLTPVERLTALFEKVRYSTNPPGVRDQREALSCLGEIVDSAEKARERA